MKRREGKAVFRVVVVGAAALTFISAAALLVAGIMTTNSSLIGFATAALPASLASAAALFGVQTWADQRAQAVDEKSREALEDFISVSARVVATGLDLEGTDLPMRTNIVTWGSPELLKKLAQRTHFIGKIATEFEKEVARAREVLGDPQGTVTVNLGPRKAQLAVLTAEAISLARRDIGLAAVTPRDTYDVLFGTVDGLTFDEVVRLPA